MAGNSRIYVAPTKKSFEGLRSISQDPSACIQITELVFLAEVLDPKGWYSTKSEFMANCEEEVADGKAFIPHLEAWNTQTLDVGWGIFMTLVADHKLDLLYDHTALLSEFISRLKNLRTVQIATKIDAPGRNEDRFFFAHEYRGNGQYSFWQSGHALEKLAIQFASENHLVTDGVSSLFEALDRIGAPVTVLTIGNGFQDHLEYGINHHRCAKSPLPSLQLLASKLTHLTLSLKDCETDEEHGQATAWQWRAFFEAARNLQSLHIYSTPSKDLTVWKSDENGTVLSLILPHCTFLFLHTLRVVGDAMDPTNVRAVWLNAFLRRQLHTIRHLELSNVLIMNWYRSKGTETTMAKSLRIMQRIWKLETAKVSLYRCKYRSAVKDEWISIKQLDDLAKDLDVNLQGGQWDFGQFLMRRPSVPAIRGPFA